MKKKNPGNSIGKNIGSVSADWLARIGITDRDSLAERGVIPAYRAIEALGIKPSRVLLYALEGAIQDCHWQAITQERRRSLLMELDAAHDVQAED